MAGIALAFAVLEVEQLAVRAGHRAGRAQHPHGAVPARRRRDRRPVRPRPWSSRSSNVLAGLTQLAIAGLVISGTGRALADRRPQRGQRHRRLDQLPGAGQRDAAAGAPRAAPARQRPDVGPARASLAVLGPTVGGILVVTVGAGWALAVDGVTYLLAAATAVAGPHPAAAAARASAPAMVADLREGWRYFRAHHLALGGRARLRRPQRDPQRRDRHPRARCWPRADAIGETGWGLGLSAQAAGFLAAVAGHDPGPAGTPPAAGAWSACALFGLPMLVARARPGAGRR